MSPAWALHTVDGGALAAELREEHAASMVGRRAEGDDSPGAGDGVGGVGVRGEALNPVLHCYQQSAVFSLHQVNESAEPDVSERDVGRHLTMTSSLSHCEAPDDNKSLQAERQNRDCRHL